MIERISGGIYANLTTGALCNADSSVRAMDYEIRPLYRGARVFGPAKTVIVPPGHNAAIHRAVAQAGEGDILVVETGGSVSFGYFGDILATACQLRGIAGLVIDGTVRDAVDIEKLKFPVFCRGTNPSATGKSGPGHVDTPIICGGVELCPGDYVFGDQDGVVVIQEAILYSAAEAARIVVEREKQILSDLKAGRTTCEIFGVAED